MAGKWHLGHKPEHDPSKLGFEKVYTMVQGGTSLFDDEWMMYANSVGVILPDSSPIINN